MAYDLKNKVVFITGAANGVGAGVVRMLLAEGVKVPKEVFLSVLGYLIVTKKKSALERYLNETFCVLSLPPVKHT